jgi:hypothetical protein
MQTTPSHKGAQPAAVERFPSRIGLAAVGSRVHPGGGGGARGRGWRPGKARGDPGCRRRLGEGRPGRGRRGRICTRRCCTAAAPGRPETPHRAPPPTELRSPLLHLPPSAMDPVLDLAPAVEMRGASSESRSPPAWGGARWSRVPHPSRLELDGGERRLYSALTPPLPSDPLCSATTRELCSAPRSRGRGRTDRCGPSRRCWWPRIVRSHVVRRGRRWSLVVEVEELLACELCGRRRSREEGERVGASGSEGGGQQSSWDAVSPRLSDGEEVLHFAATDAAATGVPTVAEVGAFWGCSMRCTCCWSRS